MPNYVLIRHGSNSANQPMCDRAPVAIVTAANREAARREFTGNVYANQYLEVVPLSRARRADVREIEEIEELARRARPGTEEMTNA